MRIIYFALMILLLSACRAEEKPAPAETTRQEARQAPAPPIVEDFEGEPRLSLFPRVGAYRPEEDDTTALAYWRTYLEHLEHTAGVVTLGDGGRAFGLRGVAKLDAFGFFSPLAVEPATRYRLRALGKHALGEGARAGIGILEFDQFLWISEQYPQSLAEKHQRGLQPGIEVTGEGDWQAHEAVFVTGQQTRMIHLVFYLEGAENRAPVLWDDIAVEQAP